MKTRLSFRVAKAARAGGLILMRRSGVRCSNAAGRGRRIVFSLAICLGMTMGVIRLAAQSTSGSDAPADPSGNAGALKPRVETAGGYNPHNGNSSHSSTDVDVSGAVGIYGLDFTRHWNSTDESFKPPFYGESGPFASGGWTHSWSWTASYDSETMYCDGETTACYGLYTTVIHSITVNYPDGRTAKFSFYVNNLTYSGDLWNPPFPEALGGHAFVDDHLRGMDPDANQFWLYLVDGGAVHFEANGGGYAATKVIDPHGLATELQYEQGRLVRVIGPDNRSLQIEWNSLAGSAYPVISAVQGGTGNGFQRVEYSYTLYSAQDNRPCATYGGNVNSWYALTPGHLRRRPGSGWTANQGYLHLYPLDFVRFVLPQRPGPRSASHHR
jgi:hypothetical protein